MCLIIPPSAFLLDERVFMSLGVLKVAAVLRNAGIEVEVSDLSGRQIPECFPSADYYGITATTAQMPAAVEIAKRLDGRAILGGPHVTLTHAARKTTRGASALDRLFVLFRTLIAGDGELAVFHALCPDAPTLINADDPKSDLWMAKPGDYPLPARDLVDAASYHYEIDGERALSMIAQLGCPFGCAFCGGRASPFLRRIRTRTSEQVVSEMLDIHDRYGVRGMMFLDDELNVNPRIVELMTKIAETGIPWRLRGFVKAELLTDVQAAAMFKAGFRELLVGFESGSDRILENIQKKATREDNTRCVEIAHRNGLRVKALTSLGHPGESYETVMATKEWLLQVRPDDFDTTIITPYPGTPYFDEARANGPDWTYTAKNGDTLHMEDVDYFTTADYYKGVPGDYKSHVWTDALTRERLVELREEVEADVRQTLGIKAPVKRHEHSMGQGWAA